MITPQMEKAFKKANEAATAYAKRTTNTQHAKIVHKVEEAYKKPARS